MATNINDEQAQMLKDLRLQAIQVLTELWEGLNKLPTPPVAATRKTEVALSHATRINLEGLTNG